MNERIGNRIKSLRLERNLTQKEFANMFDISPSTMGMYEQNRRVPDIDLIVKMSMFFNVSTDYLLCKTYFKGIPSSRLHKKGIKIPVLGKVQAGVPVEAVEDIIDYEEITEEMARQGDFFALQVRGESMEPKFSEGDVVIVLKQSTVETGDIAIVLVNSNDATIKKIKRTEQGISLIPLNPTFDPIFFTNSEIEELPVTIIGKVVELRCKF